MARDRRYDLEDLANRAGTYFNPQTEVLVVVDDSASMDAEIFNMEEFEGADWVLISDDVPLDEAQRDEILETFQSTYHGGDGRAVADEDLEDEDEEDDADKDDDEYGDEDEDSYDDDE
jgi:hypothetical protein